MTRARTGSEKQILSAFLDQQRDAVLFCLGEALFRTRTGDPLLTMEVLYQLS
jgi:hypothetical protein